MNTNTEKRRNPNIFLTINRLPIQCLLFVCLLMWWAGNCSITESLPDLIQKVRHDLAEVPGEDGKVIDSFMQFGDTRAYSI